MKRAAVIIGRVCGILEIVCAVIFLIVAIVYFASAATYTSSTYAALRNAYNTMGASFIVSAVIVAVGGILSLVASDRVDNAYYKENAIGWGVALLLFAAVVAGVLVFVSREDEYYGYVMMLKKRRGGQVNKAPAPLNSSSNYSQPQQPSNNEDKEAKTIELLKKYKELLDTGVITQEEFNEKKKALL